MDTLKEQVQQLIDSSKYEQAAQLVADSLGVTMTVEFLRNGKHFGDDDLYRDIYKITLKRGNREYSFEFGQSINDSGFYGLYGKNKIAIPREKLSLPDTDIRKWVMWNHYSDFGSVKLDKIVRPKEPTLYSVLACLQKYDVGSFEDFCGEFGYDTDSRRAKKTYKAVVKEYDKMCSLFNNDELELLAEIH